MRKIEKLCERDSTFPHEKFDETIDDVDLLTQCVLGILLKANISFVFFYCSLHLSQKFNERRSIAVVLFRETLIVGCVH